MANEFSTDGEVGEVGAVEAAPRRTQMRVFGALLLSYGAVAGLSMLLPGGIGQMTGDAARTWPQPAWQAAVTVGTGVVALYGVFGLLGWWLAMRVGLVGVTARDATWRQWARGPLVAGLAAGAGMVAVDLGASRLLGWEGFPHPPFPLSLPASYSAAVGEEILFRLFLMSGLYTAWLWLLRGRIAPAQRWAGRASNLLAALAFTAAHLGTAMALYGVTTPADLPPMVIPMLVILNGVVGLVAGAAFLRQGLTGAVGVHLGADLVWHVLYGML